MFSTCTVSTTTFKRMSNKIPVSICQSPQKTWNVTDKYIADLFRDVVLATQVVTEREPRHQSHDMPY